MSAAARHLNDDLELHGAGDSTSRRSSISSSKSFGSTNSTSTTSLVLHNLTPSSYPTAAQAPYVDDPAFFKTRFNGLTSTFDIEDTPPSSIRSANRQYKRWLYIIGGLCAAGWLLALFMFVLNGAYRHRSSIAHNPDATSSLGSGKKVTLDQFLSGKWSARWQDISWIAGPNGEDGLLLETGSASQADYLVVEDIRHRNNDSDAMATITLMKNGYFKVNGTDVYASKVWPSPNLRSVLVATNVEKNWRHSYTGEYYIFDVATQQGTPLDPSAPHGRVQLATWSPVSDAVIFTRENNMYLRMIHPRPNEVVIRPITTDGGVELFNGVPDWVYEEEVFGDNSATWWSPDGKYVAYLATNETGVPEYPIEYFVHRPYGEKPSTGEENYPEERYIKYPKAGAHNPIVRLRLYSVEGDDVFFVPVEDDFSDDDRLITEVIWAGDTGKLIVRQMNRESNILKVVLIDARRRSGAVVRVDDVNELDGGWLEVSETTAFVPKDPSRGRPDDGYIDTVVYQGYDHLGYFAPLDNKVPLMLTSGKWEVVRAPSAVDAINNRVYFIATKEGSTQRHVYSVDLDGNNFQAVTDVSNEGYYDVSFSSNATYTLLSYKGPNIPWQKVVSTPSNSNRFELVLEENSDLARQASEHELPIKIFSTIHIDGIDFNVVERRPPHFDKSKQYPVMFHLYGGPGSQTVDKQFGVDFQSYMASNLGYIVVTVDGRGTGFIGREARCAVRGNLGFWEAHDQIETAKLWASKTYVDETRIAIWGWSYGGFMTLKTLEQDAGRTFRYGMAVAPVTDWRFYGKPS